MFVITSYSIHYTKLYDGGSRGMMGVAPRSIVYPVKAFDHNGSAYVSDIILGIDWCIRNHMHIINMSFGMKNKSQSLQNIISKAHAAGIVVVASSGNDKKTRKIDYPARYPNTISVGATGKDGRIASFSNHGPYIVITSYSIHYTKLYERGILQRSNKHHAEQHIYLRWRSLPSSPAC